MKMRMRAKILPEIAYYLRVLQRVDLHGEYSNTNQTGYAIRIPPGEFYAVEQHREEIQILGFRNKCHTCAADILTDADQPWIGDHIPPTEWHAAGNGPRVLYPQCDRCANEQAVLVRALNAGQAITPNGHQQKLLTGGDGESIPASGPRVSAEEGRQIQALGIANGCHSCGSHVSCHTYIADHEPAVLLYSPTFLSFAEEMGLPQIDTDRIYLVPQCRRCSTNQGGTLANLRRQMNELESERRHLRLGRRYGGVYEPNTAGKKKKKKERKERSRSRSAEKYK